MPFEPVKEPIGGPDAFEQDSEPALLSQAVILLLVGAQMRRKMQAVLEPDLTLLSVPRIVGLLEAKESFLDPTVVRTRMVRELGEKNFPADMNAPVPGRTTSEIFRGLAEDPSPMWTAGLMEACLRHTKEIVSVAAAAAYQGFTSERERIVKILLQGTFSSEPLVRDLAATALAQADPENARLGNLQLKARTARPGEASHTTLLVHGTFARQFTWWQPGGDFHRYLCDLLPTLPRDPAWDAPYGAPDRFDWTGGYTDAARRDAADELLQWTRDRDADGLDLIAHSYGGNVAMLATTRGLEVGELVLLSCPALPHVYFPDFDRVRGRIVSIRVHMDAVLLLDSFISGALPRFSHPRIEEHTLNLWFDHSKTHDPEVWRNPAHHIPEML